MADQRDTPSANLQQLLAALTPKQVAFLQHYLDPHSPAFQNATKAAECAGYSGAPGSVQLSVQGHKNLQLPKMQRCMEERFEAAGCTFERDAKCVFEAMAATRTRYFIGPNNTIVSAPPEPDHQVRLRAVELKHRLLRIPPATTHQRLPAADSGDTKQATENAVCPNCGEAINKVTQLDAADRGLLREITDSDEKLAICDAPDQGQEKRDDEQEQA